MNEEQRKAILNLVRAAQVASTIATGIYFQAMKGTHLESASHAIQERLDRALEAVTKAFREPEETAVIH